MLFRSRNALHWLQAVLLTAGDLLVHSCECLHSSTSARETQLYLNSLIWSQTQNKNTRTVLITLVDFNKANLSRELLKYRQHITCPTRDSNILDQCYTAIKDAYHSVPRADLGLSDHCLVLLILTYRQKFKSAKPVLRTVKRWTNEAEQDLKACFDLTDWSVFEAASNDLDELTETVTSYISFCEDMCIPTRTRLTYRNRETYRDIISIAVVPSKQNKFLEFSLSLSFVFKYHINARAHFAFTFISGQLRFWIEILPNSRIRHFDNNSKEKRTIQPHVDAHD